MSSNNIKKVIIVGGGTAGWMTAAALSKCLDMKAISLHLVESEEIGTVGVGEATIPHIKYFNRMAGLDEKEFLKKTNATYKLGIEFVNWGKLGDSYIHPFGPYGFDMQGVHFHHSWLRQKKNGTAKPIAEYSLAGMAAKANKFQHPRPDLRDSPLSSIDYAYHFDAVLYAKYMREVSEHRGVKRTEGKIIQVNQNRDSGFVESIMLENNVVIEGDLFIDCSGFKGILIEETLNTGYENWSHYLPCDRAIARLSERQTTVPPYTRSTAKDAGWQWRIPLQSRTGNGYVYCSEYISDDEALNTLNEGLDTPPISEPRQLRFTTGVRNKTWNKNVVAIGLSAGFLEPLESTSIHLIQNAIARLMSIWPDKSFNEHDIAYFNRKTHTEYVQVRDFLILHYYATQRNDTPFWNYCRTMDIPEQLAERMALYKHNARIFREDLELFSQVSWFAVYNGQNIEPDNYHPLADMLDSDKLEIRMNEIHRATNRCLEVMPTHEEFLNRISLD